MQFRKPGLSPLNHKEFRLFLITRIFYTMALRMVVTVIGYELFQITRDSFSIGLAGLSEFVPVFVLALYAGHVIDKSDKRTLLLKGIASYSLCIGALIVITTPSIQQQLTAKTAALLFYVVIFFTGVIRAFTGPTTNAIIAQLVPRDELRFAASLSSTSYLTASILGHASAGFLIAGIGVNKTFYVIFFLVAIAAIIVSRIERKPVVHNDLTARAWASVKEGLSFVFSNKILLGAISLDLFAVLFGGAQALIPEFADRILQVGPVGFGWLNAAMDIGSAITIVTITLFPLMRKQGYKLMFAVGIFGLCIIIFGFSKLYLLSFIALLLAGMVDGVSVVVRSTVLQLTTPDEMRGRVSAVNSMFINSSNELGQFESGFTYRMLGGAIPAVIFGGCMTLIVAIVTWFKAPALRKFEY
ncbi:MAG: MFS transporter [Chitinophagaceae bacterium]|nr:MAG: MFS transporter [Chitinophagaceae bacterium]